MSVKSILVHVDATNRSSQRLEIARDLAVHCQARATALYAMTPYALTVPALYSAEAVLMLQDVDDEFRRDARAAFDPLALRDGCSVSWEELQGISPIEAMVQQSRYADLLVMGQRDPDDARSDSLPPDFVQTVLMQSGKPALIIPYAGVARSLPRRVLVAWNGSREAAHALSGAMPLLQAAEQVRVLSWGAELVESKGAVLDIGLYLAAHGVRAEVQSSSETDVDVGNSLLNCAADYSSDLLVMGCYGHSRAMEFVLGGATRTVLKSMTIPVVMAH